MTHLPGDPRGPDSVTVVAGTIISGSVASVNDIDEVYLQIEEVSGTPGFDVIFDYSQLLEFSSILFQGRYEGNPAHEVLLQMWDYSGTKWVTFSELKSNTQDFVLSPRIKSKRFLDSGDARVRFVHTSAGNTAHDLYIDLLTLKE
jgi:hypothetical protein